MAMRADAGEPGTAAARGLEARWSRFVACNDVACPQCGYNLRGLDGRTCPECGVRIDPAALMFAGQDELSLRAIVTNTGVMGALVVAAGAHAIGALALPGLYGYPIVARAARSGVGSLDLLLTCALVLVAGFAWLRHRAEQSRPTGAGLEVSLQQWAAWMCWSITLIKAGAIGAFLVIGLLVL